MATKGFAKKTKTAGPPPWCTSKPPPPGPYALFPAPWPPPALWVKCKFTLPTGSRIVTLSCPLRDPRPPYIYDGEKHEADWHYTVLLELADPAPTIEGSDAAAIGIASGWCQFSLQKRPPGPLWALVLKEFARSGYLFHTATAANYPM